ncbi:hypothetical protein ONS95_001680 [Cadophora gregata]|uniref:uncharacterized protein n=1 Tax=Cadophora gregata TaxID=51156 RepID=UPI0026DCB08D|nr:uncharacterized protein ONS95_001680 [Cadophora gregata]KAK0111313.1 hypothetical protein ONS95_001680 [Cadophora gregata]KAK0112218.1 hypothetical protein ONS96_001467 [Cadophora gregata f. sp. sojae]
MTHLISFRQPLPVFRAPRLPSFFTRRQCFSQSSITHYQDRSIQAQRPRQAPDRSMRVASKELQQYPSDVGLLDYTFVTPSGSNAPRLFDSPSSFAKLRWEHVKSRLRDRVSLLVLWFASPPKKSFFKRALKLSRSKVTPTAVALHRQMYTSFAEGDVTTLQALCADGIFDSFRNRIGNRQRGEKVVWELVKYNKGPKLVSYRAARYPTDGGAIRQAVVRISSTQKLTRWIQGKGGVLELVPGSGKEKDVEEYMVVQKTIHDWKEGDWQVWGTTSETTIKDLKEWERRKSE